MSHINTLEVYQEYKKSGYTEEQAICAVNSLDKSFDSVVTKEYLSKELSLLKSEMPLLRSEIRSDLAFMVLLPIALGFMIQVFLKKRGWV